MQYFSLEPKDDFAAVVGSTLRWRLLACLLLVLGCKSEEPAKNVRVDPSTLQPGPVQHEAVSQDVIARIMRLHETFKEVDASPLSTWLDNFKRDQNPEREVEIYEAIARAYTGFAAGRQLSLEAKREVYGVLIQRSAATDDDVLVNIEVKAITLDDVKALLKLYDRPAAPIRITPSP
jgi:hypothetical protein